MGNQQMFRQHKKNSQNIQNLQNSLSVRLRQIQDSTLIKYKANHQIQTNNRHKNQYISSQNSLFYLQKVFVSDSEDEYHFLSNYLQKQSLFGVECQANQIIKIIKIYQQAEKGFCSNRYLIKVLFEYSDITIRNQLKVRFMKSKQRKLSENNVNHYFKYEDLCNLMFACISSLLAAEKMKLNLQKILQKNQQSSKNQLNILTQLLFQLKYNIPMNLDRIIIVPDGTIKVMHPLLLNHNNRFEHSSNFFYSPQKMRDFDSEDGIKGRIFQVALVILQCALIQTTDQINSIYNGYCINQKALQQKIRLARNIYKKLQNLQHQDMKLFYLIQKMTVLAPQKRINLQQSVKQAEQLFQFNKSLRSSVTQDNKSKQIQTNQRMRVEQLQLPSYCQAQEKITALRMQNTVLTKKDLLEQKTTARINQTKRKNFENQRNNQIQVSNFNIFAQNANSFKYVEQTRQNTYRNDAQESLFIKNYESLIQQKNLVNPLESLIGKNSSLYNTKKFNFLQSKYQYDRINCNPINNTKIQEAIQSRQSLGCSSLSKQSENVQFKKQCMYKRLLNKSLNSAKNKQQKNKKFLRKGSIEKRQRSIITKSRFMDIQNIYQKYDFIQKSSCSFKSPSSNKENYGDFDVLQNKIRKRTTQNVNTAERKTIPFAYSLQNSWINQTNKKSQVLEKYTPSSILGISQKENNQFLSNY